MIFVQRSIDGPTLSRAAKEIINVRQSAFQKDAPGGPLTAWQALEEDLTAALHRWGLSAAVHRRGTE